MREPRRFGRPQIFALLVGSAACVVFLAGAEFAVRVFQVPTTYKLYPEDYYEVTRHNIVQPRPGAHHVRTMDAKTNALIDNVEYNVDPFGRRVTPRKENTGQKFIIFVGDSFTYGEGVKGDETLPAQFGAMSPAYMSYNYGFSGMGPFDVLARLETVDFAQEVAQSSGVVLYTFLDSHIDRTMGRMSIAGWQSPRAYYEVTETGLTRKGTFRTGRPVTTLAYRVLARSALLRALRIDIPPRITSTDIGATARVIVEMDAVVRRRLPDSRFCVLFYPGWSNYASRIIPALTAKDICHVDFGQLFRGDSDPVYYLREDDKHPTPAAYQRVAASLSAALTTTLVTTTNAHEPSRH